MTHARRRSFDPMMARLLSVPQCCKPKMSEQLIRSVEFGGGCIRGVTDSLLPFASIALKLPGVT